MNKPTTSLRALIVRSALLCVALLSVSFANAQEQDLEKDEIIKLGVEARFDYLNQQLAGKQLNDGTGLAVRYINLRLDGTIGKKFSYSWRQRLNKMYSAQSFVDNMDWLHLTYKPTDNWAISAGKQVVLIGGWEYDRAPIDLYFCSEFWNNVACYQYGASIGFTTNKGDDTITAQVCQSPYNTAVLNLNDEGSKLGDLFAYNLYWSGTHGCFSALYSLNFMEYQRGKFDIYLALGNQFKFGDAKLQIDFMTRGPKVKNLLGDNFSIMSEFSYMIAQRVNVFAKATYDKIGNSSIISSGLYPGTELIRVGGGVEYYPLGGRGNRDIRLHVAYGHTLGVNTNPDGTAVKNLGYLTAGLTWKIDVIKSITTLIDKHAEKRAKKFCSEM